MLRRRVFNLTVAICLLLGLMGPAQVLAAREVEAPGASPQATTVTLDGTPTVGKGNSTTTSPFTLSWSHTTGTGTNRLLLVGVSYNANTNVSPVSSVTFTYGTTTLTLSQAIGKKLSWLYRFGYIFYSPTEPPSGTSGTIKVTFAASVQSGIVAGAANFANVDLTTPIGPSSSAENVSAAPSVTVKGLVGDELVFDNLFMGGTTPASTVVGAGQTILTGWNTNQGNSFGGASTKDAASSSSVTMSWTPSGTPAGTFIWIHLAAAINPACAGSRYTLTLGTDPNGTVAQSPAGASFCAGRTVALTPAPATTGYVFSGWGGANAGDMVPAGGGAYTIVMNGDKSVAPIFVLAQTAPCPNTANLNAVADTFLNGNTSPSSLLFNYGGATTLQVDRGTAASRRSTLLKWDVSSIPANAIINSASIILNVTTSTTNGAFPMYDVTKPWVEGAQNGAADTAGVSWTNYNTTGPFPWGTAGASMTATGSIDRDTVNLWSAAAGSFNATGSKTVSLTAGGLTVLRRWLAGGVNNGVIIQDYAGSTALMAFDSKEGTTPPVLSVNYCLAAGGVTHDLTVAVEPPAAGTTTPSVGVHTYAENTIVPVTASAATGYIFDHWSGGCSGTTCSVTMDADKSVTANFVVAHKLTVAPSPSAGGTTSPAAGEHWYATGTVVPVTASAATGYTFANWGGDCSGNDPLTGCSVTMDQDRSVTANFTLNTYALNLTFGGGGGGRVTSVPAGIDCTGDCSHSFDYNTGVVLTAAAAPGSKFDGWGGDCTGTGTCSVTMTSIHNVSATFSLIPTYSLTLAVDPVGGGAIDPAVGIHTYTEGAVVVVAATAASGYVFDHWTGDVDYAYSATTKVTMSGDKTATAHFTAAPFGYIGDAGPSVYADPAGTSLAITVGAAGVAVGNTIIVGFASRGASPYDTPTVADSKGNTYTMAICALTYQHGRNYILYAPVTTALVGGDQIIITTSSVANRVVVASVFGGLVADSPLDQVLANQACTSTTTNQGNEASVGPTGTTAQADELVIGLIGVEDSGGTTPTDAGLGTWQNDFMAGATQKSQNTNSYRWRVSMGRYYASAVGTFTAAQTYVNTPYWNASIATFKAAPTAPTCYALTLSHTGSGAVPIATPGNSTGCDAGKYIAGEDISLSGAVPDTGWTITGWTGTNDDASTAGTNSLLMPAAEHSVAVHYEDVTPPELAIAGATADGNPMGGNLTDGYILATANDPADDRLIQFAAGTTASESLQAAYFGLALVDSTVSAADLKAYYEARGVPEPYLTYLKDAADGNKPFVYIKGATVTLVDAAKHDLGPGDVDMTVPDDFPLGTYTVEGLIKDLAGNETTVTLKLIVSGDRVAPELTVTGATADGNSMSGNLTDGYVLPTSNQPAVDHLIQFASGTTASESLQAAYFGLTLVDSTVSAVDLKAYYEARGVPDPYLTYLKDAADSIKPFVYIKGSTVTLVDAAKHDLGSGDVPMTVPDDFPLGTYTVEGVIKDLAGNETTVTLKLIVSGDRAAPELTVTGATADGAAMAGDLATGYVLETLGDPAVDHEIQFAAGTVASEALAAQYFGLKLISSTVTPAELVAYYTARGVPEPYLTYLNGAAVGDNPFVYITGSTVTLVDAAKHDIQSVDVDMTVPDNFPPGTYTVQGAIADPAGNETTMTLILVVTVDTSGPVLTITGATADGDPMDGDLATGYILETTNDPLVDHEIQFAAGTVASEPLQAAYFGLKLTGSTVTADFLKAYYAWKGVPEPYLGYLEGAADGDNPFVYIKGDGTTAVALVDAAKHDLGSVDVAMTVPDTFPSGTYTVQGVIKDLAGNETTVTLKLVVQGPTLAAPSAPAVSIVRNGGNAVLSWPAVQTDANGNFIGTGGVTTYYVYFNEAPYFVPGVTPYTYGVLVPALSFTHYGVAATPGMKFYVVRAVNAKGFSAASNRLGVFTYGLTAGQ